MKLEQLVNAIRHVVATGPSLDAFKKLERYYSHGFDLYKKDGDKYLTPEEYDQILEDKRLAFEKKQAEEKVQVAGEPKVEKKPEVKKEAKAEKKEAKKN